MSVYTYLKDNDEIIIFSIHSTVSYKVGVIRENRFHPTEHIILKPTGLIEIGEFINENKIKRE